MSTTNPEFERRLDAATSRRLWQLGGMPVEVARLGAAIDRAIGPAEPKRHGRVYAIFHSMRTVAASVAVLFLLGIVLLYTATAPVSASPNEMVKLHRDLVSGRTPVTQVDSIEAANRELARQWPESPAIPDMPDMPADHEMACCMKSVDNKRVACLLLKGQAEPVTMMVAKASDMKSPPKSPTVQRGGVTYYTHASEGLNMVSCVRDGRYVCLIGSLPAERLVDLAAELRF